MEDFLYTWFHFKIWLIYSSNDSSGKGEIFQKQMSFLEGEHLRLSNNISAKPLPQFFYLDIHAKRSLKEIFW